MGLNVSAADLDGTDSFYAIDMDYGMSYLNTSGEWIDCTTDLTVKGVTTFNGENCAYWKPLVADYDDISGRIRILGLSEDIKLNADHTYTLEFKYGAGYCTNTGFACWLYFYDSQGNVLKTQELCDVSAISTKNSSLISFSQDFKPDASDLSSYTCKLVFAFSNVTNDDNTNYLSEVIYLNDNDDNTSWFQKIYNAVVGLGDRIESIFSSVGDGIVDGIREALAWAFVPSEEYLSNYADEWQAWFESQFGIFSQVTNFMVDMISDFKDLFTGEYSFVFPEVKVPILGETYVLIEKQTVDMSQWIDSGSFAAGLYEIYTTCVWAIIIYCVFKYALVVQDVIFSGTKMVVSGL